MVQHRHCGSKGITHQNELVLVDQHLLSSMPAAQHKHRVVAMTGVTKAHLLFPHLMVLRSKFGL